VECYWSRVSDAASSLPVTHRILPDGCIDILFDLGSKRDTAFVIGPMTRPLMVDSASPDNMIAVRFRPGGAFAFFDLPMSALTDLRPEIAHFWKDATAFEAAILERGSVIERIAALESALIQRLRAARTIDARISTAVALLKRRSGVASVDSLSEELGITRQHLARKFQEQVGLSPKTFARIVRMQDVLRRIRNVGEVDWCMLALDSGYYDQAHMIDDFQDLCGISPARYMASL
jgi:AraC-like DNA-binding protein